MIASNRHAMPRYALLKNQKFRLILGVCINLILHPKNTTVETIKSNSPIQELPNHPGSQGAFKFIDLFAGLGGFHVAMAELGGECVFASELNKGLKELYDRNFNGGLSFIRGDIHDIDTADIPAHDVLCAGFPCQPFSQAGKRFGLDDPNNGNHFYKIMDILEQHRPEFFILENVPNMKGHDRGRTWEVIEENLMKFYDVQSGILSPDQFGVPQHRKRFYIVGAKKGGVGFGKLEFPNPDTSVTRVHDILAHERSNRNELLRPETERHIQVWQEFVAFMHRHRIPRFPVWATEFGADYPFESKSPRAIGLSHLRGLKGQFGKVIQSFGDLPVYAIRNRAAFPSWKKAYIQKNRALWEEHKSWLSGWVKEVQEFEHSHQKFEWNAGDSDPTFRDKVIQFRPSGIRVKNGNATPALVLSKTQVPIVWDDHNHTYRYISPLEAGRLQSFDDDHILPSSANDAYRALGNAVNSRVVTAILSPVIDRLNLK